MISQSLRELAETFAKYSKSGMELEPDEVKAILAILNSLTADAAALERIILALPGCIDPADMAGNVVAFPVSAPARAIAEAPTGDAA